MSNIQANDSLPCDIRIDKQGVWFYKGSEMFRKDIVQLFYQHLIREDSGKYVIQLPNDRCYIEVEDVPFVVTGIMNEREGSGKLKAIQVSLNDDTYEALNPESLRIGQDNILYCTVKGNGFEARFSRASYYQLADYIEFDSDNNYFYIEIAGEKFPVTTREL